jgi:hypothetical protein
MILDIGLISPEIFFKPKLENQGLLDKGTWALFQVDCPGR